MVVARLSRSPLRPHPGRFSPARPALWPLLARAVMSSLTSLRCLVDDDEVPGIISPGIFRLQSHRLAKDAEDARNLEQKRFDVVVLDVMLQARWVRFPRGCAVSNMPVLMLTCAAGYRRMSARLTTISPLSILASSWRGFAPSAESATTSAGNLGFRPLAAPIDRRTVELERARDLTGISSPPGGTARTPRQGHDSRQAPSTSARDGAGPSIAAWTCISRIRAAVEDDPKGSAPGSRKPRWIRLHPRSSSRAGD
jgi:hypothetical protein